MLLKHDVLSGIETGRIGSVYRRWDQARVKAGSNLRTAIGVIEVLSVDAVDPGALTQDDAAEAGFESVPELSLPPGTVGRRSIASDFATLGRILGWLSGRRSRMKPA